MNVSFVNSNNVQAKNWRVRRSGMVTMASPSHYYYIHSYNKGFTYVWKRKLCYCCCAGVTIPMLLLGQWYHGIFNAIAMAVVSYVVSRHFNAIATTIVFCVV